MFVGNAGIHFPPEVQKATAQGGAKIFKAGQRLYRIFESLEISGPEKEDVFESNLERSDSLMSVPKRLFVFSRDRDIFSGAKFGVTSFLSE